MTEVRLFRADNVTDINKKLEELGLDSRDIIVMTERDVTVSVKYVVYYHKEVSNDGGRGVHCR